MPDRKSQGPRFASDEEAEIAFKALEAERPEDLELMYAEVIRGANGDADDGYTDVHMPSLLAFLEALPIRPEESNRLKVAFDLFDQVLTEIASDDGPRSYKYRKN